MTLNFPLKVYVSGSKHGFMYYGSSKPAPTPLVSTFLHKALLFPNNKYPLGMLCLWDSNHLGTHELRTTSL